MSRTNAPQAMGPTRNPKISWVLTSRDGSEKYSSTSQLSVFKGSRLRKLRSRTKTEKELWGALERKYKTEDAGTNKFFIERFLEYKMVDNKFVVFQVQELQMIIHDLLAEGLIVNEAFQVTTIIEKLPPLWKDFKNYLKHKHKEMIVKDLIVRLCIEKDNKATKRRSRGNSAMNGANIIGHKSTDCCAPKKGKKKNQENLAESKKEMDDLCAMLSECNLVGNPCEWWMDSGATCYVCANKELFSTFAPAQVEEKIYMENSATAKVEGTGKVSLKMTFGKVLTLNNVLVDFLHLSHVEFFGYDFMYNKNLTLEQCKQECLDNCECKGFQYNFENDGIYSCYLKTLFFNGYRSPFLKSSVYINICSSDEERSIEVSTIGKLSYMNLIDIWGYCAEVKNRLLGYDYMEHGSLADNLHHDSVLDWEKRFETAPGTTRGLACLHEECLEWALNCDIKPQNIVLDSNYEPKVVDFGLSKLLNREIQSRLGIDPFGCKIDFCYEFKGNTAQHKRELEAYKAWKKADSIARGIIVSFVVDDLIHDVRNFLLPMPSGHTCKEYMGEYLKVNLTHNDSIKTFSDAVRHVKLEDEWLGAAKDASNAFMTESSELDEPNSVIEALSSPEKDEWINTMKEELESMKTNKVWDLVDFPSGRKTTGNKWILKVKLKSDGSIERHKA
ncbi:putative glucan endo-1,3-beta-glucosidase A-like [Capsicum annuum]|nr:putative glucan endo-1,3-beta-glucosidase A-like [Capsicum annuum]